MLSNSDHNEDGNDTQTEFLLPKEKIIFSNEEEKKTTDLKNEAIKNETDLEEQKNLVSTSDSNNSISESSQCSYSENKNQNCNEEIENKNSKSINEEKKSKTSEENLKNESNEIVKISSSPKKNNSKTKKRNSFCYKNKKKILLNNIQFDVIIPQKKCKSKSVSYSKNKIEEKDKKENPKLLTQNEKNPEAVKNSQNTQENSQTLNKVTNQLDLKKVKPEIEKNENESKKQFSNFQINSQNSFNIIDHQIKKSKPNFAVSIIGLNNIGNTCYINSFLQILLHTPGFLQKLKSNYKGKFNESCMINCLIDLSENPTQRNIIKKIKKIMANEDPTYGQYIQNDSQKFGISLLGNIYSFLNDEDDDYYDDEDEVIQNSFSSNEYKNEIKKKFAHYLKKFYPESKKIFLDEIFLSHESLLKCNTIDDEIKKISFESFMGIDLSFPKNHNDSYDIYDLFNFRYPNVAKNNNNGLVQPIEEINTNHLNYQELANENNTNENYIKRLLNFLKNIFSNIYDFTKWLSCSNRKNNTDNDVIRNNDFSNRRDIYIRKLVSLPKVLIISIQRGFTDVFIKNKLRFFEKLSLGDYIESETFDEKICKDYKLYAINQYITSSGKSGHYNCYIKIRGTWYLFDDSSVYRQDPEFTSKYVAGLYYLRNDIDPENLLKEIE